MTTKFVVEDQFHAEWIAQFDDEGAAIKEVRRLFALPWDEEPNRCPCGSWETCGREYELLTYDATVTPWRLISRRPVLNVSA
ncbi:MAG: hypothetical protein Q8R45_07935, partial [Brevundimonas sp.]|uniref:hypothetical protein n=1 Tax=Brevundimonas sp. TaxID=1871086 RepID=UPI0027338C74